jgi:energy-coupling factor transport system ATP-binding protein
VSRIVLRGVGHVHNAGTPWAQRALRDLDLTVEPGERLLVVGTNGSGKSTLAWLLGGLLAPTEGTVTLDARPMVEARDRVGLVVQHARLQLLRPTIGEELEAFAGEPVDRLRALSAMGFGAAQLSSRIDDLSIGQQRRVAIAGQLARRSAVLVLDEPMAGLDAAGRRALVSAVGALPRDTIVVTVTHDLEESRALGSRLIELGGGSLLADRGRR